MNCPVDGTPLLMTDRQGIEIDYCPKCRGIWLDRGELDKLIERAGQSQSGSYGASYTAQAQSYDSGSGLPPIDESKRRLRSDFSQQGYPEKRKNSAYDDDQDERGKKESLPNKIGDFLGDIFDIF